MRGDLKPEQKSNLTLTVNNDIMNEIKRFAESRKMSVNALVSEMLEKNMLFYRYVEDINSIIIPPKIFSAMLENIDENLFCKLIKQAANEIMPSIMSHTNVEMNKESLIKYAIGKVGKWSGMFSNFKHYTDSEGNLCFVFEHHYGIKWSRILSDGESYYIENILQRPVKSQILPNSVIIKVKE